MENCEVYVEPFIVISTMVQVSVVFLSQYVFHNPLGPCGQPKRFELSTPVYNSVEQQARVHFYPSVSCGSPWVYTNTLTAVIYIYQRARRS
mgnify:FL=1